MAELALPPGAVRRRAVFGLLDRDGWTWATIKATFWFLLIIFRIATLYSPVKLFAPAALSFFLTGVGYYAWTFATQGRFTNMSALLLSAAVIVFLIGLISEQITALTYRRTD